MRTPTSRSRPEATGRRRRGRAAGVAHAAGRAALVLSLLGAAGVGLLRSVGPPRLPDGLPHGQDWLGAGGRALLQWARPAPDSWPADAPALLPAVAAARAAAVARDWAPLAAWLAGALLAVWCGYRFVARPAAARRDGGGGAGAERRSAAAGDAATGGLAALAGAVVTLAGAGGLLLWLAGLPWAPSGLWAPGALAAPSVEDVRRLLLGPGRDLWVPLETVAAVVWTACWVLWAWAAASLVLSLLVGLAEALTRGAAWAGRLAAVVDRLSLPVARRVADRAVVAVVAVHLAARVPAATAAPELVPAAVLTQAAPGPLAGAGAAEGPAAGAPPTATESPGPGAARRPPAVAPAPTVHVVRPGDTLWAIAGRYYGDGALYPRLVEANAGRVMPTGERFARGGVIRPGWPLEVPDPAPVACAVGADGDLEYTVVAGDSLSRIAERYLGDRECWRGLYALNRGLARLGDGRTLSDPNLIWPGLRLRLPRSAPVAEQLAAAAAAGPAEAPPAAAADAEPAPAAPAAAADAPPPAPHPALPDEPSPADGAEPLAGPTGAPGPGGPGAGAEDGAGAGGERVGAAGTPGSEAPPTGASAAPTPVFVGEPVAARPPPAPAAGPLPAWPEDRPFAPGEPAAGSASGVPAPAQRRPGPAPAPEVAAAGLAALAGAAGALLLARRHRRRSLDEPPPPSARPPSPPPEEELADAAPARGLRGGHAEPAVRLAAHARRFVEGRGLTGVVLALVEQRHGAATLVWWGAGDADDAGDTEAALAAVAALADAFAARVGGRGRGAATPDGGVAWSLSGLKLATLLPEAPAESAAPPLLALGQAPDGATVYADWESLGHVLVAGLPGGGAEAVLTSLVVALAAQASPRAVRVWGIGDGRSLPWLAAGLPHLAGVVRPGDAPEVSALLERLRADAERRLGAGAPGHPWRATADEPALVLVVGELADLPAGGTALEQLGTHGPAAGVRVLAATTRLPAIGEGVLAHFATRIGLQAMDDAESVRLLGVPEAADLAGGELLVRPGGRSLLRLRGFRVSDERLEELGHLMRGDGPYGLAETGPDGARGGAPAECPPDNASTTGTRTGTPADPTDPTDSADTGAASPALEVGDEAFPAVIPESSPARGGGAVAPTPSEAPVPAAVPPAVPGPAGRPPAASPVWVGVQASGDDPTAGRRGASDPSGPSDETGPLNGTTRGVDVHEPAPPAEQIEAAAGLASTAADQATVAPLPGAAGLAESAAGSVPAAAAALGAERPLLAVQCLGAYTVRSGGRELAPTGEDGAWYRSWEVLAYLAAYPGGVVPRERLLAALWPDVAPEKASSALRAAMSRLRGLLGRQVAGLGPEVVRSERDGTCRLDAALVWSDAQEFWARCQAAPALPPEAAVASLERAVSLYAGDLVASRAARAYDWLDEPGDDGVSLRRQYREEFYRALQRLARLHRSAGRPGAAVPLYRRLLQAEPILEDIVRELYRCYRELGDLASLVREDRHLRQALRTAFADPGDPEGEDDPDQYDPEPETVALFREVRAELEARAAATARVLVGAAGDGGDCGEGDGEA